MIFKDSTSDITDTCVKFIFICNIHTYLQISYLVSDYYIYTYKEAFFIFTKRF